MGNTALKLNLPKRSDKYWLLPYSLCDVRIVQKNEDGENLVTHDGELVMRNLRFSEARIVGEVYSFSNMKNKPNEACKRSYKDLEEVTEYSRGTVSNGLKTVIKAGILSQTKHFHDKAEYRYEEFEQESNFFITFEKYLQEREFEIPREARRRRLKNIELWIVSVFGSLCNKPKANGCDFTINEICEKTGACEKVVRNGIRNMISAGFLSSRDKIKHARKNKRLHFNVEKAVRLLMVHTPRRSKREKTFEEKAAEAAELRGEIERYHASNRQAALDRAEKNRKKAEENADFKKADSEMKECEISLAHAEAEGQEEKVRTLSQTLAEIKERRRNALKAVALTEADLMPDYKCKKCSDKGFLPDGRMCDCYSPRGAP